MIRTCNRVLLMTSNKLFPIEVHTRISLLLLLLNKIFDRIVLYIGKSWATGSYMNLLTYRQIKEILMKLNIKKYKIIRNRLFFFYLLFYCHN